MKRTREERINKFVIIYSTSGHITYPILEEFPDSYPDVNISYTSLSIDVPSEQKSNQFISNGMNNIAKKINKNFEYEIENSGNRIQTRAIIRPFSDEDEKQTCQLFVKCLKTMHSELAEVFEEFLTYEKDIPSHIKEQVAIPYENKNEAERKIKFILQCIKKHYQ